MDRLFADLSCSLRQFGKNPGFTLVAVVTLALGIGANTTIFSVINALLLQPLPYPNPDRLAALFESDIHDSTIENSVSAPNFQDWQRQNDVFEELALFDWAGKGYDLSSRGQEPERVSGVRVSAGFFSLLGVKPLLGRSFLPEEEQPGRDHEVVLSYGLWSYRYHADRSLIGTTIKVDGEPRTVVGVMPPSFQFQFWSDPRQLFVPAGYTLGDRQRRNRSFMVLGRLKPDITLAHAGAQMNAIGRRLAKQYPEDDPGLTVLVKPLGGYGMDELQSTLLTLLAAVGFVLLMACVNVANLMLARGATRQKEFALRSALGAGRADLIRQLLTESILLALLGGAAGVVLAMGGTALLVHVMPRGLHLLPMRPIENITIDSHVLGFAFLISCLTGILFGLMPALSAFRVDLNDLLRQGGRACTHGRSNLRYLLVASEVSLAMVVLSGAGLLIESTARLLAVNPGFDPKNVLALFITSPQVDLYNGPPVRERFCLDLDQQVANLPGVMSVSSTAHLPFGGGASRTFVIEGAPDPGTANQPDASYNIACPRYLSTMRIPLLAGREFSHRDTVNSPGVIMINQTMAHRYWRNQDAIGKRIKLGLFHTDAPWLTVVGVYGDVRSWGLDQKPQPQFMRPYTQAAWPYMAVIIRTASAPGAYAGPLKRALSQIDPDLAGSDQRTLDEVVRESVGSRSFPMYILTALAALALLLAAVGIAGVVSYTVTQRTNEIGIRMTLGACVSDVLWLVLGRSMRWAVVGVVAGSLGSLAATRLLSSLLFNVRPADPLILSCVAFLLASVALVASYLPARRATKVDPMVALRSE